MFNKYYYYLFSGRRIIHQFRMHFIMLNHAFDSLHNNVHFSTKTVEAKKYMHRERNETNRNAFLIRCQQKYFEKDS